MIAALPMYDAGAGTAEAMWLALAAALRAAGVNHVPDTLTLPDNLLSHWRDPALLLSQTCGYPLTHALAGQVQLLGAWRYRWPGCDGAQYRSWLIARADDPRATLDEFAGATLAYNSDDSQSGYHSLRRLLLPHDIGSFFGQTVATGAHRKSIAAVRDGYADLAAIDCVSYALLAQSAAAELDGIRIIGSTPQTPGLPLITSLHTSTEQLTRIRVALQSVVGHPALAAFGIVGFEALPLAAYPV
ncbi:phosphate/phosphite/phosphonate ABC transporter substrate-binding protein [Amantichitinum ursilacus]|uniref:ABC transporter, phosphonate, periplasmic substrate-binding protein n=1 Tax=Amantichitinum ursilacus TaxID=857265 RepID=A0A0N0XIW5_9NEIS|nr:PhnD/SsuA/transferrin family substrate-binding protein [Amantichitinum ursilacus]KPC51342.1 ABC transporter, phosphonate, periplasmic substrate-binding protein [Amantichitinum ursilacus]